MCVRVCVCERERKRKREIERESVSWDEPAFACRGSHDIRPQFDEISRRETIDLSCSEWEDSPSSRPFANRAAAIVCSASRTN